MTYERLVSGLSTAAMLATLAMGVFGTPAPAEASVLFRMNSSVCALFSDPTGNCLGRPMPEVGGTVSGPTLITTPTANGGADFTIPAFLYSTMGSFTATYAPIYPYFGATFTRYNEGGSIMANAWTGGISHTFVDPNNAAYPNVPGSPHPGFIRAKAGPNGMAGPNEFFRFSDYYALIQKTVGIVYQTAVVLISNSGAGSPTITQPAGSLFTVNPNVSPATSTGAVIWREPSIWALTGTVTISQPNVGTFANTYLVVSAQDNRTAAGASGTIQVVSAGLNAQYTVLPLPPQVCDPACGTAQQYRNGLMNGRVTTFDFIPAPEPGQLALIGAGIAGLAGVGVMRRRR